MSIYWPNEIPTIKNRYFRSYISLIERTYNRSIPINENIEEHHIIPYSFYITSKRENGFLIGNPDDKSNLVKLTVKEHYIAHRLLEKFTTGIAKHKMAHAITMMNIGHIETRYKIPSRVYEYIHRNYKIGFKAGHASRAGKIGGIKGGEYAILNRTGIHNLSSVSCKFCNHKIKKNHISAHSCNTLNSDIVLFFKKYSNELIPRKISITINNKLCLTMASIANELGITVFQANDLRKRFSMPNS